MRFWSGRSMVFRSRSETGRRVALAKPWRAMILERRLRTHFADDDRRHLYLQELPWLR
jgi:hypothetical protein